MSVELANQLSSLISVDNLETAQMQADFLSAAGIFLTVVGFAVGGAMIGATTAIIGISARLISDDINNRIDQETTRRASLTSKNLFTYLSKSSLDIFVARFSLVVFYVPQALDTTLSRGNVNDGNSGQILVYVSRTNESFFIQVSGLTHIAPVIE